MKKVRVRKPHDCTYCGELIPNRTEAVVRKEKYLRIHGGGSYFETYYYHLECPKLTPDEMQERELHPFHEKRGGAKQ